jgi:hypothetical protein
VSLRRNKPLARRVAKAIFSRLGLVVGMVISKVFFGSIQAEKGGNTNVV